MAKYKDIFDVPDGELPPPLPLPTGTPPSGNADTPAPQPDTVLPPAQESPRVAGHMTNGEFVAAPQAQQFSSFGGNDEAIEDIRLQLERIAQVLERIEQIMA